MEPSEEDIKNESETPVEEESKEIPKQDMDLQKLAQSDPRIMEQMKKLS